MKILSLCDGIACARLALERAGIPVTEYYASEIKKHAIECVARNFPDIIQVGDVRQVSYRDGVLTTANGTYNVGHIDLVCFGSPC